MDLSFYPSSLGFAFRFKLAEWHKVIGLVLWITFHGIEPAFSQQEVAVDKFTGTAHVSIPLHTVSAGGVVIPISLEYAAKGVRVDDEGGLVGTNWNLTAAPSIHREVRGLPDDIRRVQDGVTYVGWLTALTPGQKVEDIATASAGPPCSSAEQQALTAIQAFDQPTTVYDSEPDIFTYNLPGHSGKFVFDKDHRCRTIPYDPIEVEYYTILENEGFLSITIKTPEGNRVGFGPGQRMTETWVNSVPSPQYWTKQYANFKQSSYITDFSAANIITPSGERITFFYTPKTCIQTAEKKYIYRDPTVTPLAAIQYYITKSITREYLVKVESPTTTVDFDLVETTNDFGAYLTAVRVSSALVLNTPSAAIKQFTLEYASVRHEQFLDHNWYDGSGENITDKGVTVRRFLTKLRPWSACSELPPYTFTYSQVTPHPAEPAYMLGTCKLPPVGCAEQDYWGYYNANRAKTLVPKLFVAASTASVNPESVPHFPYRLYPLQVTSLELPGADRRPTTDLQVRLAGTLIQMQVPTGGQIQFTYEPHRFFDALANQTFTAGGLRLQKLQFRDNITNTVQTKLYDYSGSNTLTSGRLLTAPHFAFTVPGATATPTTLGEWAAVTVRTDEDIAPDPFEGRTVGYGRVTEKSIQLDSDGVTMMGTQGKTEFSFAIPLDADQVALNATGTFPAWQRTRIGIARNTASCPSVSPVQAGTSMYPFPTDTNYEFMTGMLVGTRSFNNDDQLVQEQTTEYTYKNVHPSSVPVAGLVYEKLMGVSAYAYGKYTLLTDFLVTPTRQTNRTISLPSQTAYVSSTSYRFNNYGQVATVIKTNSDGTIYRTRNRYLSDYPLTQTNLIGNLRLMQLRWQEGIRMDLVETISEVIRPNSPANRIPRLLGSSLQTYTVNPSTNRTRPFQTLGWQTVQSHAVASAQDSTHIELNSSSPVDLVPGALLHAQATVQEVNAKSMPITSTTTTGRQIAAVHVGYADALPVLQIQNAFASHVLFSNFETSKDFAFGHTTASVTKAAHRTGMFGYELGGSSVLTGQLINPPSTSYRLTLWARTPASSTLRVRVTPPNQAALPPIDIPLSGTGWRYYEREINLVTLSAGAYQIRIEHTGTSTGSLALDDVTLLPARAQAVSTTYDPARGKTSQTDPRGRTMFYNYDPAGRLSTVLDQDGSIVTLGEHVTAGVAPHISPAITASGALTDGGLVVFTAAMDCLPTDATFSWDFGDGSLGQGNGATHRFSTNDQERDYTVQLTVISSTIGRVTNSIQIHIERKPLTVEICRNGLLTYDLCLLQAPTYSNTCSGSAPLGGQQIRFQADATGGTGYTYEWQVYHAFGSDHFTGEWQAVQTGPSPMYTVMYANEKIYRCVVRSSNNKQVISDTHFVNYYSSGTIPCPPTH
ncbi:PKD domain-containing protein [Hymenobacter algoricola]|uniref:PKD domain-containing protein n=1 Tax=Hymenobacter algoricola TaxID=486267 RepID=A0ABP7ND82_9BACT